MTRINLASSFDLGCNTFDLIANFDPENLTFQIMLQSISWLKNVFALILRIDLLIADHALHIPTTKF
jgi:hypothetical protein